MTSAGVYRAEQPEGGWHILLVAANSYKDPRLKIANGTPLHSEKDYQGVLRDLSIAIKAPGYWDDGEGQPVRRALGEIQVKSEIVRPGVYETLAPNTFP